MGIIKLAIKVVGAAALGQLAMRALDYRQEVLLIGELEELTEKIRAQANRHGTVQTSVRVRSCGLVEEHIERQTTRSGERKLRESVEIFYQSIPD